MITKSIAFQVQGLHCRGVLHLPEQVEKPPIIVMGNGYATEWQFGTKQTIQAFVDAGFACLNFDYRHFGKSDGEPRQVVDIQAQLEDWRAALIYAAKLGEVDGQRMAVWGSSLGGGHAISIAAENPQLKAMIAQVPHCCSNAAFKTVALSAVFKGVGYAALDSMRNLVGMKPLLIPVLSEPGEYGVMTHPGWREHYLSLVNEESQWKNEIPARSLFKSGQYRPILVADKIACPSLVVYGENDPGCTKDIIEETAAKIPNSQTYAYPGDHFDVYGGGFFDDIIAQEVAFFKQHLQPAEVEMAS